MEPLQDQAGARLRGGIGWQVARQRRPEGRLVEEPADLRGQVFPQFAAGSRHLLEELRAAVDDGDHVFEVAARVQVARAAIAMGFELGREEHRWRGDEDLEAVSEGTELCGRRSLLLVLGLAVLAGPASAVTIDWVTVGSPGNAPDTASNCYAAGCGSVADVYRISKYEVTNAQYAEFLNTKAASDPLALYSSNMGPYGGITRSGSPGSYTHAVKPGFADKPVNYVSFYDSLRFTNWLGNGQGTGDTETGAYTLLGGTATPSNGLTVTRNPGASIFLPSENEWYKAAYYDGLSASFFDYPAGTNTPTVCAAPGATPNTANCGSAVGNVTDVGAYTGSASPYGTFDQGGNVWEWNEEIMYGSSRGLRGGSWNLAASIFAASLGGTGDPTFGYDNIGFRVASLPEPGTSMLLMTGLAGLALRQGRS